MVFLGSSGKSCLSNLGKRARMEGNAISLKLIFTFCFLAFHCVSTGETGLSPTNSSQNGCRNSTDPTPNLSKILKSRTNSIQHNSDKPLSQHSKTNAAQSYGRDRRLLKKMSTNKFGNKPSDFNGKSFANTSVTSKANDTDKNYTDQQFCKKRMQPVSIVYAVFLILIILVALTGNTTAFIIIISSRILRKQTMYYFLASLALTDILVALSTIPVKFKQTLHNQEFCMSLNVCKFLFISDGLFTTASIMHLLMIAVDRLLQIMFPYMYPRLNTKKRSILVIVLVWLYSAIWAALSTFDWSKPTASTILIEFNRQRRERYCYNNNKVYFIVLYCVVFIIPLIMMLVAYSFILKVAWKLEKKITKDGQPVNRCGRRRSLYVRELRASKTVVVVFAAFIVCYLPVCVITLSSFFHPKHYTKFSKKHPHGFLAVYIIFVQSLPPLNHCVNPFIYVIMNKEFGKVFRTTLFRLLGKPVSVNTYASPSILSSRRKPVQKQGDNILV